MKNGLIRNHLRNMIILGIPMRAIWEGAFFPDCRLRISDDGDSFGLVGASGLRKTGRIALAYTLDGYIYGLETATAASNNSVSVVEMQPIDTPERIARIERRKSYRATCPEDEPVKVLVNFGVAGTETEAIVISEDSIGLSLPPEASAFGMGSTVTMTIGLPRLGDIDAAGTVRFIRDSSGSQGLVIRFDDIGDADRGLLRRYVRSREIKARAGNGSERRESSFIVAKRSDGLKHIFWCPAHLLGSIDLLDEALEVASVDALDFL